MSKTCSPLPIILIPSATFLADLLCRNYVNNALSGPPTPLLASTAVTSAPLSYDNFSSARLLKFCQHAIPTFSTPYHVKITLIARLQRQRAPYPLPTIPIPSATLQICHVENYVNSALPILFPLKSASVCGSYKPLMALP